MKTFVNADLCNTSEKCINKKIYIRISKFVTKLTQQLVNVIYEVVQKKKPLSFCSQFLSFFLFSLTFTIYTHFLMDR